jgi:5-formyltetrahydrofolate cyclo-ligase
LRALRRRLAHESPDAAARAAALLPLKHLPRPGVVGAYHALGAELNPQPVVDRLLAAGWRLALPTATHDEPLAFRAWRAGEPLVPDAFGIPCPAPDAERLDPDLVIAPLVAFDRRGGRLGQGGGHYDRTLANLRARKPVFILGLAYAGQEVDEVPAEPHDQRLDAILSETGYIEIGGAG